MREQDGPAVADPLVEIDPALRALRRKVGRFTVDSQCHDSPPLSRLHRSDAGYPWENCDHHLLPLSPKRRHPLKYLRAPTRQAPAGYTIGHAILRGGTRGWLMFQSNLRVTVDLSGLVIQGVSFSQNVQKALGTILQQVSTDPPVYKVELLFSFKGIKRVDLPEERIHAG